MMTKQLLVSLMILLSIGTFANPITTTFKKESKNDVTKLISFESKEDLKKLAIEQQLLTGSWVATYQDLNLTQGIQTRTYQFNEYGSADIINTHISGKMTLEQLQWNVEEIDENMVIRLVDLSSKEWSMLWINTTNDQVYLFDELGKTEIKMTTTTSLQEEVINSMKFNILGQWNSAIYPFDLASDLQTSGTYSEMKGANLTYQFNADGTYTTQYSNQSFTATEQGVWEITKDGQYLIFYVTKDGRPETTYDKKVAKINNLNSEDFVLTQSLSAPDFKGLFNTKSKAFYLAAE